MNYDTLTASVSVLMSNSCHLKGFERVRFWVLKPKPHHQHLALDELLDLMPDIILL